MREKIKHFREKISSGISSSSTYKTFLLRRDKLAKRIKNALQAFFNAIGPMWTFMFVKTQDPDELKRPSNEIRQDVIEKTSSDTVVHITVKNERSHTQPFY